MVYLQLENNYIPKGNYTFLYDVTGDYDLFDSFYEAEKNLKVDYHDFAHKIRIAFEAFALFEEAKHRCNIGMYESEEDARNAIVDEIKEPSSVATYKSLIIDLCDGREMEFAEMLKKYSFIKKADYRDEVKRKLGTFIRFLYGFGSESSHKNVFNDEKYIPNRENCFRVAGSFHDFLALYYHHNGKFDSTIVPIRDYIPVPKKIIDKMGLSLDVGKWLYLKDNKGQLEYYIFSNDNDSINNSQRRDIDTISKLWEDNFEDPVNVIRKTDTIIGSEQDYRFQIYRLPSKPMKLTREFLENLSGSEKIDIISGICKGVNSLHSYIPPMYHRNINPDAFYFFKIRGKYKPLLAKFDCTKDLEESEFTVFGNVEKRVSSSGLKKYFAPELRNGRISPNTDWEKADVYSLAATIAYILSENDDCDDNDIILNSKDISEEVALILCEMLSDVPGDRPSIEILLNAMS